MAEKELSQKSGARRRRKAVAKWVANGLCSGCGKEKENEESPRCNTCKEYANTYSGKNRDLAIKNGMCGDCKHTPALLELKDKKYPRCESCYYKETSRRNGLKSSDWIHIKNKLISQNFTCPYTGDRLILGFNASLEHIKPQSKFPELISDINNIEWVTLEVNKMKNNTSREDFLKTISKIYKNLNNG